MILVLTVRFLDNRYHGLTANGDEAEWPPSPFRLFQAIVAGNAHGTSLPEAVVTGLTWLESLPAPRIGSPLTSPGQVLLTYVLNNSKGRSRTPKTVRPTLLPRDTTVSYVWEFDGEIEHSRRLAEVVVEASRHIRALGWGIDMAIGSGSIVRHYDSDPSMGRVWMVPTSAQSSGFDLRVARRGSLRSLQDCYLEYLGRFTSSDVAVLETSIPVYGLERYQFEGRRPYIVFKLVDSNDDTYTYPHANLIHLAGMVRHLAIEAMTRNPPRGLREPARWIEQYVAGHRPKTDAAPEAPHAQLSFVPLPSVGHAHADPGVRRVMIVAPFGDDEMLEHLSRHLDGRRLVPESAGQLRSPVFLSRVRHDGVIDYYTNSCRTWASFTPVILPGHDDRKPEKTEKLIRKALSQSGIEQPCDFEWSAFSHFAKSYSAHRYVRDARAKDGRRSVGYMRPGHLVELSAVHLRVTFENPVPGPLTIGAGRHCGFGLMVGLGASLG